MTKLKSVILNTAKYPKRSFSPASLRITAVILLVAFCPLEAALDRFTYSSGRTIEVIPGQVLVKYKSGREHTAKANIFRSFRVQSRKNISPIGIEIVPVPPEESIQSFLQKLKSDPDIELAEPNGILRALTAPNDPGYASQYALDSSHISVEAAWDITQGTSTVVIAVVDTGITLTHQDLDGNLWVNPSPSGNSGLNGTRIEIDWNGDNDCLDTDATAGPEQCAGSDPTDDNNPEFHGTRVSGIIAAETNNGLNMAGIARNCRLMGVKALNSSGAGSYAAIAEAITYAADNGAAVINLSLGGTSADSSGAVQLAINYAINQKNAVVVAAAGNSGNSTAVNFPASLSNVIAVGATNANNTLASFSCTGSQLDLVAPGVGILTTIPVNNTGTDDGTSFSAPMVSAVAALMKSLNPNLSPADITDYINFTATDLGASGYDTNFGFGMLNAARALLAVSSGTVFVTNPADTRKTFPYPNPFQPGSSATVQFSFPNNQSLFTADGIEITVYNSVGEKVKTLNNTISWDGRNDEGNYIASGLYFYYAKTPGGEFKGKLTVLK